MKKDLFNLRLRNRWLLVSLLALLAGTSPAWAGTGDTNFDDVTLVNPTLSYGSIYYGTQLSNNWVVQGGSIYNGGYTGNYFISSSYKRGDSGLAIDASQSGSQTAYLITPAMSGDVTFWFKSTTSSSSSAWQINVYEATENGESFDIGTTDLIPTLTKHSGKGSQTWTQVTLSNVDGKNLAFKFFRVAIDDFEGDLFVETGCKKPKNLEVSNLTDNSADLSWTAGEEGQDTWQIVYSTDANFDKDAATPINVNSTSYSFSELDDNTTYYVGVRSYCGAEDQSAWATTSFKTPLAPITSFPWSEDFNSLTIANTIPDGWDNSVGTTTSASYKWCYNTSTSGNGATNGTGHDGKCIRFDSYNNSSNNTNFLKTPIMNFPTGAAMQLKFWYKNPKGGDFSVFISNDGGATYATALDGCTGLTGASSWTEKVVDLPTDTYYNNVVIVFKGTSNYGSGDAYIYLDDVLVKENAAYAMSISGDDVVSNTIAFGEVKNTSTTKTFTISNDGASTLTNVSVVSSDASVFTVSDTDFDVAAGETKDITVTFVKGVVGDYSETVTISQANIASDIVLTVTGSYATPSVANMAVKVGDEAVGATVAFGNVGKQTTKAITIANTGEADLVISSITSSNTTDFTVSPASLTVQGGSSETFTVTFLYDENALDEEKTANITVTPSNEGIDPVVFAVTGTRIEQWSEDFSENALPEGWERTSTTYWTFADGVAKGAYSYSAYYLITPSLNVESTTDVLTFDYVATGNYVTIHVQKSKNGGDWESCTLTPTVSSINTGASGSTSITGLEAGIYKFRFKADDYNLDNFQGFKRNMNDPKMGVYSDETCETAVATSVSKDFGFATETQTANYYIKNDGTGTMTLSLGDAPDGITQALDKTSVAAGEHATLTITMPAANKGYNGGNVVVTATDLGTFTVAVSGVIVDDTKMNLNFATDNIPSTWTTNSWSKNASGYVEVGYSGSPVTMQTSNLTAVAGEDLVVIAKQSYTTSSYSFGVKYKKTDAESWSDLIPAANIGTSYVMLHGTIAEAGTYQLQFNGQYTQIQRIYGLSVPQEPVMVVYDGESLAAATYNFGNVSDEADAVKTFTVKNEGQAELTGLAAALTGDDADHYSVEVSATTIAVNGTATITVKQLKDNLGAHAATLTISATGLDSKVIALSGNTYDHTKQFVDFEDGNLPTGWTKGSYWSVSQVYGQDNHSLGHSYGSSSASSVVTTPLTVAQNEVLSFGASRYYSSSAPTLKVRYTADGGLTWSEYEDFSSEITSSYAGNTFKELTLEGVPAGTVVLEFYGSYVRLDNIYGFTATTAPLFALAESSTAVENNSTKEFGTLTAQATATYTLTNNGNGAMVSTVATTGVATAAISGEGEGVTISENTVTLAAGKSATITLTLPYEAPFGEKAGDMTITTEGWVGDFTVNYTATTVDPTALYIDFAGNAKPEGWYQDGWSFTNGYASAAYVANKQMITQKLTCAGTDDVLSFDVWPYTSSYGSYTHALTVEYSADRKNWTAFANQPTFESTERQNGFQVSGAPAGDYYVRFTGSYVYMDNIAGWHKVTGIEHDLYVSATTFPTTALIPETSNGVAATATVYSLRADEEGVYAKLFFDDEVVATSTAKDISKDGSQSFTMTCNVPAEEKTYAAKIVVYYGDETVAWETATTDVVVSQTRTMQITDFALTSDATAEADADNQFTSTFNVTVKNTGSLAYTPAQVSVNVTDAEGNAYGEATTWTAANSQTMFIVPGAYTNDNAVLAIYRFNTGEEDAEWAELTKISDNFYSAELNNKAKFIVVRLKNSEADGYDATNNGLNWANMYNQSVDLVPGTANCFTFNGWEDKDGDKHYFGYSTMTELAKGVSTTLKVTVTTSALEGGEFTFKAKENMSNTVSTGSAVVTVTAAAPKFELSQAGTAIADGDAVAYGVVKEATTKTFTITNAGTKTLEIASIAAPEGFEYEKVAANGEDADWKLYFYRESTEVNADQGNFKATATDGKFIIENVTVPFEGVNFAVHNNDWSAQYGYSDEGGHLNTIEKATKLATASNASGWMTIAAGTYDFIWNANDLTLTAKVAGSILVGESADVNVTLKADQGKVSGDLVFTYKVDATTNKTFTLALSGRSIAADTWAEDFEGESPLASWYNPNGWGVYESSDNNVLRLTGWDAKAIYSPRLTAEDGEELTFDVTFIGNSLSYAYSTDHKNWSDEVVISSTGEQTFTAPEAGSYYLRFTGRNAYLDNFVGFKLDQLADLTLDDTEDFSATVGRYDNVTLGRSFNAGWATVVLPFAVDAATVSAKFGADTKLYDLTSYVNDELTFTLTDDIEAGKPYLMKLPANIEANSLTFSNVVVESTVADYEVNGAWFKGNYEAGMSMAGKYGVTGQGKLAKGGSSSTMKGFRAYIELPANVPTARIMIDDTATGIKYVLYDEAEMNGIYNLQGQRVEKAHKGLYIVNGQKVFKK